MNEIPKMLALLLCPMAVFAVSEAAPPKTDAQALSLLPDAQKLSPSPSPYNAVPVEEQWAMAEGLFRRGFFDDAETEYRVLDRDSVPPERRCKVLLRLADCAEKKKAAAACQEYLERYVKMESDASLREKARLRIGMTLAQRGEREQALKVLAALDRKIDGGSLWESGRYESARILLAEKKRDEASAIFAELAALPWDAASIVRCYASFVHGEDLRGSRKLQESLGFFRRVAESQSAPAELREAAWLRCMEIKTLGGDHGAVVDFYQAFKLNLPEARQLPQAALEAGRALLSLGRPAEALRILDEGRGLSGSHGAERQMMIGLACYALQRDEEALAAFHAAAEPGSPQFAAALSQQLLCLVRLHRHEECLKSGLPLLNAGVNPTVRSDAALAMARSAIALKREARADELLELAIREAPPEWPGLESAARLLAAERSRLGMHEKASAAWKVLAARSPAIRNDAELEEALSLRRAGLHGRAAGIYAAWLERCPREARRFDVACSLIETLAAEGRAEQAFAILARTRDGADAPRLASLDVLEGRLRFERREPALCLEKIDRALADPALPPERRGDALLLQSMARMDLRQPEQAAAAAAELVGSGLRPIGFDTQRKEAFARLLETWGRGQVAAQLYAELADAGEDSWRSAAAAGRARQAAREEKWEEAAAEASKALELAGAERRRRAAALVAAGIAASRNPERSLQLLTEALALAPEDDDDVCAAATLLAEFRAGRGEHAEAMRLAARAWVTRNHPLWTPRALLTARGSAKALNKPEEAAGLEKELRQRYPAVAIPEDKPEILAPVPSK
ncbi:MAG: hypothetical protein RL095_400 [Verrucomicrobiota bacterium]|jgi:hypothetical protein